MEDKNDGNKSESEEDTNNDLPARVLQLDLGDDLTYNNRNPPISNINNISQELGPQHTVASGGSNQKKTDNPFSFKHFLNDTNNGSKAIGGARPKIKQNNRNHEFPSILPDFVQDHLILEHSYSSDNRCGASNIDTNLFESNSNIDEIFNLRTSPIHNRSTPMDGSGPSFPFDLTSMNNASANPSFKYNQSVEIGNSKSLPDFLTDGPVRPQQQQQNASPLSSTLAAADDKLLQDFYCHNCASLHAQLTIARRRASRLEEEVERNNRRATVAENTTIKLKQELKALKVQNRQLYSENEGLRNNGSHEKSTDKINHSHSTSGHAHQVANQLRATADAATVSLQQLLSGIDQLRFLANDLENVRQENKTKNEDIEPFSPN